MGLGRKRSRKEASTWDDLDWKTVDVQLEQDDGWSGGGGDSAAGEGCLFGALEEIDGSAYTIQKDDKGVTRVSVWAHSAVPGTVVSSVLRSAASCWSVHACMNTTQPTS
jgi:hypothetical protein